MYIYIGETEIQIAPLLSNDCEWEMKILPKCQPYNHKPNPTDTTHIVQLISTIEINCYPLKSPRYTIYILQFVVDNSHFLGCWRILLLR